MGYNLNMPNKSFLVLLVGLLLFSGLAAACALALPAQPSTSLAARTDEIIPSVRIQSLPDHFKP